MEDDWVKLRKEYKKRFKEDFDLYGLYWNNPSKDFEILVECIETNKPFSEVLSKEEMELIEGVKRGEILF